MNMIKDMNKTLSTVELDPVAEAIKVVENLRPSPKDEMIKIADHWRAEGKDMQTEEVVALITNDLEMLEYSPEEINNMTTRILKMLGRQL